jgi:hypothetical protein
MATQRKTTAADAEAFAKLDKALAALLARRDESPARGATSEAPQVDAPSEEA